MRLSVMLAFFASAFAVSACDRAEQPAEQAPAEPADATADAPAPDVAPGGAAGAGAAPPHTGNIALRSGDGLTAELTRDYAGGAAPAVRFTGADGRKLGLGDFSGRPLLVNIWATWCAPCKHEMPALDRLAEMEAGQMSVIAISQDTAGRAPVRAFFESAKIVNLEGYNDPKNHISQALAPSLPLPATVLYDSNGREVWRVIGPVEWDSEEIAALLDEAA